MDYKLGKYMGHAGIGMVCAGVLLLVLYCLLGWSECNFVLVVSILLTLAGLVTHVVIAKKESRY